MPLVDDPMEHPDDTDAGICCTLNIVNDSTGIPKTHCGNSALPAQHLAGAWRLGLRFVLARQRDEYRWTNQKVPLRTQMFVSLPVVR